MAAGYHVIGGFGPGSGAHYIGGFGGGFGGSFDPLSPPDADITQADCTALGGSFMKITGWMVHPWVVPSWESPDGVFSHENPNLRCADGTFNTDKIGRCQGS
jgi:hypothetical protein